MFAFPRFRHWRHLVRVFIGCFMIQLLLSNGCSRRQLPLKIQTDIEVPPVLISEILAAEDRLQLGKCPVEIVNSSSENHEVKLLGTGCSCYGVTFDGKRLANGETFTIPARKTRQIQIEFQPIESHSERSLTADLGVTLPDGTLQAVSVKCRFKVLADIRLTPSVITVEALPETEIFSTQTFVIEHNYRGESTTAGTPEFSRLPDSMQILSMEKSGVSEQVAAGLWRQRWVATAQVYMSADRPQMVPPLNFQVSVPNSTGRTLASGQGSLMVHTRQTIAFPNRVHFGKVAIGMSRSRRILLTSTEDSFFRLRCDPTLLPPYITVNVSEHSDERHLVELVVTPREPGPFSDVVKLQTDMYDVTEIAVRVEGVADPQAEQAETPDTTAARL